MQDYFKEIVKLKKEKELLIKDNIELRILVDDLRKDKRDWMNRWKCMCKKNEELKCRLDRFIH